jgi:hypothetical protein
MHDDERANGKVEAAARGGGEGVREGAGSALFDEAGIRRFAEALVPARAVEVFERAIPLAADHDRREEEEQRERALLAFEAGEALTEEAIGREARPRLSAVCTVVEIETSISVEAGFVPSSKTLTEDLRRRLDARVLGKSDLADSHRIAARREIDAYLEAWDLSARLAIAVERRDQTARLVVHVHH